MGLRFFLLFLTMAIGEVVVMVICMVCEEAKGLVMDGLLFLVRVQN